MPRQLGIYLLWNMLSFTNLILRWTQTPADLVNRVFQSNNMSAGNWLSKASLLNIRKSLCKSSSFVLLKFFTYFKASGWQQSLGDSKDRDVRKLKGLSFGTVSSENIILLLKNTDNWILTREIKKKLTLVKHCPIRS